MKIETKQVVTLTKEEKEAIDTVFNIASEILDKVNDPDIYKAAQLILDGIEELGYNVGYRIRTR